MPGLVEAAISILKTGERSLEVTSSNISNTNTFGFKRSINMIENQIDQTRNNSDLPVQVLNIDQNSGTIKETGNPFDILASKNAYFLVRNGDSYFYTKNGQFFRDQNGNVVNAQNMILQQRSGSDLVLETNDIEIIEDGTVLQNGSAIASVGLFELQQARPSQSSLGSLFPADPTTLAEAEGSSVRQGMLESSNVILSDEMIKLMANTRQIEMGAQIMRYYDQLMGQAITTFSRSGK